MLAAVTVYNKLNENTFLIHKCKLIRSEGICFIFIFVFLLQVKHKTLTLHTCISGGINKMLLLLSYIWKSHFLSLRLSGIRKLWAPVIVLIATVTHPSLK